MVLPVQLVKKKTLQDLRETVKEQAERIAMLKTALSQERTRRCI